MNQIRLPSIDTLLSASEDLIEVHGRQQATLVLREVVARARERLVRSADQTPPEPTALIEEARAHLMSLSQPSIRTVFNLTGTVLHTNLGRAVLPRAAIDAVTEAAGSPVNLEYDIEKGNRGDRDDHVEQLLCELTGAESATVVNNNAAAVLLLLNTLAIGKEVIVSRGELVEIGGSFRIPEIMDRAGCRLCEVGATNRTHVHDYENAIGEASALLMKVHTSNYEIRGFTTSVSESELVNVASRHNLPVATDLGSGSLVDLSNFGLPSEPVVRKVIESGADLVTFSGDKLLGGPQSGIIVGRRELISRIKSNPLKRALRVDKMILAALEAGLQLYRNPDKLTQTLPALGALTRSEEDISAVAEKILPSLKQALALTACVQTKSCLSQIGSGALPSDTLSSLAIVMTPKHEGHRYLDQLVKGFRALPRPVIGRISEGALLLDLRTLSLSDTDTFIAQLDQLAL